MSKSYGFPPPDTIHKWATVCKVLAPTDKFDISDAVVYYEGIERTYISIPDWLERSTGPIRPDPRGSGDENFFKTYLHLVTHELMHAQVGLNDFTEKFDLSYDVYSDGTCSALGKISTFRGTASDEDYEGWWYPRVYGCLAAVCSVDLKV